MQPSSPPQSYSPPSPLPPKRTRVRLRLYHDFERPRNGREVLTETSLTDAITLPPHQILSAISPTVDTTRFKPHIYATEEECFIEITPSSPPIPALPPPDASQPWRIDIKLVSQTSKPPSNASSLICDSSTSTLTGSWFSIGIIRGKTLSNHGTLWRSALQFGAAMTFTIGKRYAKKVEGSADIFKTYRQIPCLGFEDVAAFFNAMAVDAQVVVIEYGGEDLITFQHPKRAVYVLGSEDSGVPPALVQRAHKHVSIPTAQGRPASLNVAAAGVVVMYDRMMKLQNEQWHLRRRETNPNAAKSCTNGNANLH